MPWSSPALQGLERDELVRGELRWAGPSAEWCDPDVLRRIRGATLAVCDARWSRPEQAALELCLR